jgi:hypothetical protein
MKLIHMLSVGVATVGMTCLVSSASAANTAPGSLTPDSMLVAQSTPAPGGKGGGAIGEPGRADKGTTNEMKVERGNSLTKPGMGTDGTSPEKAKPGTDQPGGNSGSSSGSTGTSSGSPGSSKGPTVGNGSSETSNSGSSSKSGSGGGSN